MCRELRNAKRGKNRQKWNSSFLLRMVQTNKNIKSKIKICARRTFQNWSKVLSKHVCQWLHFQYSIFSNLLTLKKFHLCVSAWNRVWDRNKERKKKGQVFQILSITGFCLITYVIFTQKSLWKVPSLTKKSFQIINK